MSAADILKTTQQGTEPVWCGCRWGACWRHLANTVEPSACGSNAALCQVTLSTCYYCCRANVPLYQQLPSSQTLKTRVMPSNFSGPPHLQRLCGRCYTKVIGELVSGMFLLARTAVDSLLKHSVVIRGVATVGDTADASPVRPTMSPYTKMTTDSLSSELTFDE